MRNILITFISDNKDIIGRRQQDLEELTDETEVYRENLELEITDRADMVRHAKFLLEEIDS